MGILMLFGKFSPQELFRNHSVIPKELFFLIKLKNHQQICQWLSIKRISHFHLLPKEEIRQQILGIFLPKVLYLIH